MIATGNIADIMVVDQKTMNAMQKNDQLADLTEVYANCASDRIKDIYASYGEEILQGCTFDGKLMAFPETNIRTVRIFYGCGRTGWKNWDFPYRKRSMM